MTDAIEKTIVLRAPRARVWRAIADADEFGRWFGFVLEGPFVEGAPIRGRFSGTLDEAKIREAQARMGLVPSGIRVPTRDLLFGTVVRIEPERCFAYRWVPYGIDDECDPETEPTTLVEMRLEDVPEGTKLVVRESGFDAVPPHRRERAFRMNEGGWAAQCENVRRHVEGA